MPPKTTPKTRKPRGPRQHFLSKGLRAFGTGTHYHKRGVWSTKGKVPTKVEAPAPVTKSYGKKGETRTIAPKGPRSHPWALVGESPLKKNVVKKRHSVALKSSIKPGQVLILLAGVHRGKRVVFLKQLPSGLLLVTGPYKVNGVPLRRVNQVFTLTTSTTVDISGVKLDNVNDDFFKKVEVEKKKKSEDQFFADKSKDKKEKKKADPTRVSTQKAVDSTLLANLKKDKMMRAYLSSRFSLRKGQHPHQLKF